MNQSQSQTVALPTIKEIREGYPDTKDGSKEEVKRKKKKKQPPSQDSVNLLRQSMATTIKLLNEFEP
jgi:hypothetical protein